MKRIVVGVALVLAGLAGTAAPAAAADKADLVWYLDRTFREVVDVGAEGDTHGDITVTNGTISEVRGGKAVGSYVTSQITARVDIPGGRQDRKTDIAITVNGGTVYTTALVAANAGTSPTKTSTHAIIGGTGKYSGVAGQMVLKPLTATGYRASFYFVD